MILNHLNMKNEKNKIMNLGINLCHCRFSMIYALAYLMSASIVECLLAYIDCLNTCLYVSIDAYTIEQLYKLNNCIN